MRKIVITAAALAALAITGCTSTGHSGKAATAAPATSSATVPATPAAAPAPDPSPDGTFGGSCDVSLSDSLNGQDYLTADVNLDNTGNVGTITRVRVSWGQQGFSSITEARNVRLRYGASKTLHFHYAASIEQVSRFQDVQLADDSGDGCKYHAANVGTFGSAH